MVMAVGNDEFCIKCMEWREYDNKGRCKICKNLIHKIKNNKISREMLNEYDLESSFENEENNSEE